MKWIRQKKWYIIIAAGILVCIAAILFFTPFGYRAILSAAQSMHTDRIQSDTTYPELDDALNANMIFAVDAVPQNESQFALCMDFVQYLNRETGLSYIGADLGFSRAELLNLYLESGNTAYFDTALSDLEPEQKALWQSFCETLFQYCRDNRTDIRLFGLCNDNAVTPVYAYISALIDRCGGVRESTETQIYSLLESPSDDITYLTSLYQSYTVYPNLYNGFFGGDYLYFSLAMDRCAKFVSENETATVPSDRTDTFNRLANRFIRGKYLLLTPDTDFLRQSHTVNSSLTNRLLLIRVFSDDSRFDQGIHLVNNLAVLPYADRYMWLCDLYGTNYDRDLYDVETRGAYSLIWNP